MQVNELGRDVIVFFKRIHQQYACLPAVAATLGASANIERDEKFGKLSRPINIERQVSPYDSSIGATHDIIEVSDTHCVCEDSKKNDIPSYFLLMEEEEDNIINKSLISCFFIDTII